MTSSAMTRILRLCAVVGLTISAHWAVPAWAAGAMVTGGLTSQPIGHYDFCKLHPNECNIRPADLAPARMTDGFMRKLINVSARVNAAVKPMSRPRRWMSRSRCRSWNCSINCSATRTWLCC